jgi:hypothetical protein
MDKEDRTDDRSTNFPKKGSSHLKTQGVEKDARGKFHVGGPKKH